MNFWKQLRWIGSALFIALALLLVVFAWQERQDTPDSDSTQAPAAAQSAPLGNTRGL
jgi:hypothetical protein